MNKFLVILFLYSLSIGTGQSQGTAVEEKGHLRALFNLRADSIQLRWAPDQPRLWKLGNQYGYVVERLSVNPQTRGSATGWVRITPEPLKPLPLDNWEPLVERNEKAGVIAQALYGDTFASTQTGGTPLGQALLRSQEQEQRFGFSLLIADQFYDLAKASGLAFTDRGIRPDRLYFYRIYIPIPASEKYEADTAYVRADRQKPLAAPQGFRGEFGNRVVQLQWDLFQTYAFSGYWIERSTDGKNFARTHQELFVQLDGGEQTQNPLETKVLYTDSLPANEVTYYYRLRGQTPFGEQSPPSAPVQGKGFEALLATPSISIAGVRKDGQVLVKWEFPEEEHEKVQRFDLRRSTTLSYGRISADSTLSQPTVTLRQYLDPKPLPFAYYQVVAVGKHNEQLYSNTVMIELPDSIGPAAPVQITGSIDTLGVVTLRWAPNTEPDLAGYRVQRSNTEKGQFVQVTREAIQQTQFKDTLDLNTTTLYVYYRLVAEDKRYNPSAYSEVLRLRRPDRFPPVAPQLNQFDVRPRKIVLQWTNSPSEDLDSTFLFRRKVGEKVWRPLFRFKQRDFSEYADTTGLRGERYEYHMVAQDESGKRSADPQKYLSLQWLELNVRPAPLLKVFREKDVINLEWATDSTVSKVLIFRKVNDKPQSIYQWLRAPDPGKFADTAITPGSTYTYLIKLVYTDKTESIFSNPLTLKHE